MKWKKKFKTTLEWAGAIVGIMPVVSTALGALSLFFSGTVLTKLDEIAANKALSYKVIIVFACLLALNSIFFVVAVLLFLSKAKMYKNQCLVYPHFGRVAKANADCDKELYASLFMEIHRCLSSTPTLDTAQFIAQHVRPNALFARQTCYHNIDKILDNASSLFSVLTGDNCSVALKAREGDRIEGVRRDGMSKKVRSSSYDEPFDIDNNTAFHNIIRIRKPYYLNDNLKLSERKGEYVNTRRDWGDDYNATLVFPIYGQAVREFTYFLCIDNHKGGLHNEGVLDSAAELCDRLGVMVHRALSLEGIATQTSRG